MRAICSGDDTQPRRGILQGEWVCRGKHVQFLFQTRRCQELVQSPNFMVFWYGLEVVQPALHQQWSPLHIDSRSHVPWSWRAVPMSWSPPHEEWVDEDAFVWLLKMGQGKMSHPGYLWGRWVMLSFGDDKATRCWRKWICMDLFFPEYLNWAPPKAQIIFVLFPLRPIESGKCWLKRVAFTWRCSHWSESHRMWGGATLSA